MGSVECASRNVPWLQFCLSGENWHNNHHGAPSSASTWVRWYQVDLSYVSIRAMEAVGLAWNVRVELPVEKEVQADRDDAPEFVILVVSQVAFVAALTAFITYERPGTKSGAALPSTEFVDQGDSPDEVHGGGL